MTPRRHSRGQTLYDFAIGMAIFLLVVGYVFAFIPGLFSPFSPETDSSAVRADRTADLLTEDLLAANDSATALNETCTAVLFGISGVSADDCARLSGTGDQERVRDRTALPATTNVNLTLVRKDRIATNATTGDRYALGPPAAGVSERVIRAVRVVSFDGRDHRFVVRIW